MNYRSKRGSIARLHLQVNIPCGPQWLASVKSGGEMPLAAELEILTYVKRALSWLVRIVAVVESFTGNLGISPEEAGHVHKNCAGFSSYFM